MNNEEMKARDVMDKAEAILQFFGEDASNHDVAMTLAYATAKMLVSLFVYVCENEDPISCECIRKGLQAQYLGMLNGFIEKFESRMNNKKDEDCEDE